MQALRKKITLWSFAIAGLISALSPLAHATSTCENVFNNVPEFEIRRTSVAPKFDITYRAVHTEKREFFVAEVLGKTDDVLLGFAPYGHAYLVSGDVRMDGNVFGWKTTANSHMAELDTGIIIRIKKSDFDNARLKRYDDTHQLSCGKAACSALAKAGDIFVAGDKSSFYSPYTMLQAIFKNGFRDGAGNPIPHDIYYIGKFDLPATLRRVEESSVRIRKEVSVKYGMIGSGTAVITASLLYFFGMTDDEPAKAPIDNKWDKYK